MVKSYFFPLQNLGSNPCADFFNSELHKVELSKPVKTESIKHFLESDKASIGIEDYSNLFALSENFEVVKLTEFILTANSATLKHQPFSEF